MSKEEAEHYLNENIEFMKDVRLLKRSVKFRNFFAKDVAHLHSEDKIPEHLVKILTEQGYLK